MALAAGVVKLGTDSLGEPSLVLGDLSKRGRSRLGQTQH